MPFGAEIGADGVRFRLWAPDAQRVDAVVDGIASPMRGEPGGWFAWLDPAARAGSRYGFRIDGGLTVPDPASRAQPDDAHRFSMVVDPTAFTWSDQTWRGRPWEEVVLYELHVGTFSPEGTFAGVIARLDHLAALGVTAIELMPVADFPGARGWGYDGVSLFAPEHRYGSADDLKHLIQAAHHRGMMVFLDVVYNHFGPDGNYLGVYASSFFTERHQTPWGKGNNFDGEGSAVVRRFFTENALYWLEEFHFDGLRLDAVQAIIDDSQPHFLIELARRVRGAFPDRRIHLVVESDDNVAALLSPGLYDAQWNDDLHHALHVLLTGETNGYYRDYRHDTMGCLGRALTEGFAYQGEVSEYRGRRRGQPSAFLPPLRFVGFLQNHDQVGNRAHGERLDQLAAPAAVEAALAILLLAPAIPLLFMGEEWGSRSPFLYFCDFVGDLGRAVRDGRGREYRERGDSADADSGDFPDPNARSTFRASILDWDAVAGQPGRSRLALVRRLLTIRHREIIPRLYRIGAEAGYDMPSPNRLAVWWRLSDGAILQLRVDFHGEGQGAASLPQGRVIYASAGESAIGEERGSRGPGWSVTWTISGEEPGE
jgi:malto-oligosyltrehalose trehalohydrolase